VNLTPSNPNASPEVRAILNYLSELSGNGIITGQHTKTKHQEELTYIKEVTGKLPALCGFELLGYSPNINYDNTSEECLKEVIENKNTMEEAWKWADKKGLITFTWHWFSPLGGFDKAFYAKNTDFNVPKALIEETDENKAFKSDMDKIAEILKEFRDKNVPILWRPFHEAEGDWFWWGHHGPEVAKKLYRMMYDRYTNIHHLNNLIWVWNSPLKEGYVGDDVCDVISRDMYPPAHQHSDHKDRYEELIQITPSKKIAAIAEIGTIPSVPQLSQTKIPWVWFMTWCNEIISSEKYTTKKELYQAFNHDYAITLDKLPKLY
jgi:mannan endo-1,4-beta-mannosidase